jgi:hypothetical protein
MKKVSDTVFEIQSQLQKRINYLQKLQKAVKNEELAISFLRPKLANARMAMMEELQRELDAGVYLELDTITDEVLQRDAPDANSQFDSFQFDSSDEKGSV